jgi:purine-nucleoside phosphorylase
MNGVVTAVMTGRIHFYEGHSLEATTIPVRLLTRLGIKLLLTTNAAGGVDPSFRPGDIMVITDHISFLSMSGQNCLRGPNLESFGPRFPSVTEAYHRKSKQLITEAAAQAGIDTSIIHEGIYCQVSGPSYETPAELRFIRMIGGSAVGMSTVNEIVCAAHGGVKVVAMSLITNACVLVRSTEEGGYSGPTHEEVLQTSKLRSAEMENLVYFLVPKLIA